MGIGLFSSGHVMASMNKFLSLLSNGFNIGVLIFALVQAYDHDASFNTWSSLTITSTSLAAALFVYLTILSILNLSETCTPRDKHGWVTHLQWLAAAATAATRIVLILFLYGDHKGYQPDSANTRVFIGMTCIFGAFDVLAFLATFTEDIDASMTGYKYVGAVPLQQNF